MNKVVIKIQNLFKSFGKKSNKQLVLNDINLEIYENEMVGIVGPSGSGKSTLLSILGLLDEASEGRYDLSDNNVNKLSNYQKCMLRNQNIGWIFQNFNLIGDMTVQENIELPLRFNKSLAKADYEQRSLAVLKKVGLSDKRHNYPNELSGGQQQRVAIARALVTEPDILLCDEPTGNLDSKNSELIMQLFQSLHQDGATILLITHSENVAKH